MDSADIPDTSKVTVMAHAVGPKQVDAALEQIVGRLSLEPHIFAATWEVERTIPEECGAARWSLSSAMRPGETLIHSPSSEE
jgi:hypothetical protein